ncbi:septation ring formation regulator EzrA [Pontibacillus litoralis]|uniref:Septation ring formation regulator EzrA n=1 Tax=Pontibacillus litoralis JSM 072002 TaxID=1385512 RepID=A0A0A5HZU7_9BACI|nr:septation ring formation regulator EzrA [Pontibacillus litoralis]KGX89132.1 selenide, water dikinase [Pontibacillus litoralis JSM 072002]
MEYVIMIVLAIVGVIIYGLILRKKVYDEVDRLEDWKLQISSRNVTDELSKVKSLNLSGETQEQFEKWRDEWEDILNRKLPDLEEGLFNAEEHADRYRFKKANEVLKQLEQGLHLIEASIDGMLQELENLLKSEEEGRKEVEDLEPQIKELKKKLLQQRYLFGKAEHQFEQSIAETQQKISEYYEHVEAGNYFEAHDIVEAVKANIEQTSVTMDEFPELYKACKKELPAQFDELLHNVLEMKNSGYRTDHYEIEKEISNYQERVKVLVEALEQATIEEAQQEIPELEKRLRQIYDQLEKEAVDQSYVVKQYPSIQEQLQLIVEELNNTKNEVELLQSMYHVTERDIEMQMSVEQAGNSAVKHLEDVKMNIEDEVTSYTIIREKLERLSEQVIELKQQHEALKEQIASIRKEEKEAKEQIAETKQALKEVYRKLQKSNIPGIPRYIEDILEVSRASLMDVQQVIEEQPLNMEKVQVVLNKALNDTNEAQEQTDKLLDQANGAELVIQYGNRYRSKYPLLASKLDEAEEAFRMYKYDKALEIASQAIEEVEPGALSRIQDLHNIPVG